MRPRPGANDEGSEPHVTALVLAAGRSTRMGRLKPLVELAGESILARTLRAVRESKVHEIVVVLGHEANRVREAVTLEGTVVVENPDHELGMSTSLQAGLRAADPTADAYLVVLGDQPFVSSETLDLLLSSWKPDGPKIIIPTFGDRRGNPVLVDRSLAAEVETIRGDIGCRALFATHPDDLLEVGVNDPGILLDLDTPGQLESLSKGLASGRPIRTVVKELVEG